MPAEASGEGAEKDSAEGRAQEMTVAPAGSGAVTIQELAASLIQVFEGCRLTAYLDTGGVATIGFGSTHINGQPVHAGQTITLPQAYEYLAADQAALFKLVESRPLLEAAALVSFGYNVGMAALERVLAGHALLTDFVHDRHGNTLPGLVARRNLEQTLILVSQQR